MRVGNFFTALLVIARLLEQLLPFIKRHRQAGKTPLADLQRKYKGAARLARFVYRRGVSKGQRQGQQQERQQIARRMLKMRFEHTTISKVTGLSRREIKQL